MYELALTTSHVPAQSDMETREITIGALLREVAMAHPDVEAPHCIGPPAITDQITDRNTPYCDELRYAVSNDIRMLAVIRCRY